MWNQTNLISWIVNRRQPDGDGRQEWYCSERGQSLVELSLVLVLALMFFFYGLVNLGFVLYSHVQVAGAARDGARAGSLVFSNTAVNNPDQGNVDSARREQIGLAVYQSLGRLSRAQPNFLVNSTTGTVGVDPLDPANPDVRQFVEIVDDPLINSEISRSGSEVVVTVRYNQQVFFPFGLGTTEYPASSGNYYVPISSVARMRIQ